MVFKHKRSELYLGKTYVSAKQRQKIMLITLFKNLVKVHLLCLSKFFSGYFFNFRMEIFIGNS